MTRVSIYDPFADVLPALFRGVFAPSATERAVAPAAGDSTAPMRMDVSETAQGYVVRADLPGVPTEAIQIDIDGNRVTLRTTVQRDAARADERLLRSERHTGDYARSFAFSEEIDDSRASAKVEHGVLELVLPKKTGAGPTRLTVQ
jgi:HSP20 family protein